MRKDRNIVLVVGGGLRQDVAFGTGTWAVRTPNLDAFAADGLKLGLMAASPAATPSLVSLFTGLHPRQHGLLDEGATVGRLHGWLGRFVEAGYYTAGVGRVALIADHLNEAAVVNDIASPWSGQCAYMRYLKSRGLVDRVTKQRNQRFSTKPFAYDNFGLTAPSDDVDGFITQQSLMLIESLPQDKPWILVIAYTGPGNDLPAPPAYLAKVKPDKLGGGFVPLDQRSSDDYADCPYPRALLQQLDTKTMATIRHHYLGRVAMFDNMMGLLADTLDRCGHGERTWVAITSDRGKLLGERGLLGHRSMLRPAVEVPLWLLPPQGVKRFPDPPQHGLMSTTDLAATLCMIGAVDAPHGSRGQCLLPAMHNRPVGRESVISEYGTRLLLATQRHRVVFDIETDQPRSLFDIVKDPRQQNDLIGRPDELVLLDMLRYQLAGALLPLRPTRWAA
ncbi:MAG: sulfatase-like hydrolase/transferase [Planctomycetes bacterium]|nr:sulfatase-like hydrolase/transferase [Planctomycetota bacterium]